MCFMMNLIHRRPWFALVSLLGVLVTLAGATPTSLACYRCNTAGANARCDSGFFAGSENCVPVIRHGVNGPYEDCDQTGNCVLWIISLDTVGLPSQGSEQSTDGAAGGLGSGDGLVPLTWVCADDLVVDSTGPAGEASR